MPDATWKTRWLGTVVATAVSTLRWLAGVRHSIDEYVNGSTGIDAHPPPPRRPRRRPGTAPGAAAAAAASSPSPGPTPCDDAAAAADDDSRNGDMLIVGHRGASARAPENTLAAFRLAVADGFSGIELDVHMSRDGRIFVLHDRTLRRTCLPAARAGLQTSGVLDTPVRDLDWAVISRVPVGVSDDGVRQYPPLLSQVLQLLVDADNAAATTAAAAVQGAGGGRRRRIVLVEFKDCGEVVCDHVAGVVRRFRAHANSNSPARATTATVGAPTGSSGGEGQDPGRRRKRQAEVADVPAADAAAVAMCDIRFISFRLECVARMKGPVVEKRLKAGVLRAKAAGLDGVDINADAAVVTEKVADFCDAHGQELLVWVSPTARESCALYAHMTRKGVTVFTSDLPTPTLQWKAALERRRRQRLSAE